MDLHLAAAASPEYGINRADAEAAKMHDGGAAIMAKIVAAAHAAGVTNPIDSRRAAIVERHRAELAAVAAAEAAQVCHPHVLCLLLHDR